MSIEIERQIHAVFPSVVHPISLIRLVIAGCPISG